MDVPLLAWSMKDGDFKNTGLNVHMLLTGRYFAIGTQWPEENTTWLTKSHASVEEARTVAVHHTGMLEKSGDTLELGPVAILVYDQRDALARFVDRDVESATLDYLFDEAMLNGLVAEVIPDSA